MFKRNGRQELNPSARIGGGLPAIKNDEFTTLWQILNNDFTINGDNIHTGINTFSNVAGVTTNTVSERTAAAGVNVDGVLHKDGGVSTADESMFAGFIPLAAQQALSGTGATNVTSYCTRWTTTGANTSTLAVGARGQRKRIVMVVDAGDGVLTPAAMSGGTTITFNDVGDYVELICDGTTWYVIENSGCAIA